MPVSNFDQVKCIYEYNYIIDKREKCGETFMKCNYYIGVKIWEHIFLREMFWQTELD